MSQLPLFDKLDDIDMGPTIGFIAMFDMIHRWLGQRRRSEASLEW